MVAVSWRKTAVFIDDYGATRISVMGVAWLVEQQIGFEAGSGMVGRAGDEGLRLGVAGLVEQEMGFEAGGGMVGRAADGV